MEVPAEAPAAMEQQTDAPADDGAPAAAEEPAAEAMQAEPAGTEGEEQVPGLAPDAANDAAKVGSPASSVGCIAHAVSTAGTLYTARTHVLASTASTQLARGHASLQDNTLCPGALPERADTLTKNTPSALTQVADAKPAAHVHHEAEDPLSLPPHGTEIFMGGVPRAATDGQLLEFAAQAGEVGGGSTHDLLLDTRRLYWGLDTMNREGALAVKQALQESLESNETIQ